MFDNLVTPDWNDVIPEYEKEYGDLGVQENRLKMYFRESLCWAIGHALDWRCYFSSMEYLGKGIGTLRMRMKDEIKDPNLIVDMINNKLPEDFSPDSMRGCYCKATAYEPNQRGKYTLEIKVSLEELFWPR